MAKKYVPLNKGDIINIKGFRITQYFWLKPTPARNWAIRYSKLYLCHEFTILISGYALVIALPRK